MKTTLGHVLLHIYDFPFEGAVCLPCVNRYEADTPCVVAWGSDVDEVALHQLCLIEGFKNWLNVAVISDTCDDAPGPGEEDLITAFNEDCREGNWLWKMMNYRA